MAIVYVVQSNGNIQIQELSTDVMPNGQPGWSLLQTDTGATFYWDPSTEAWVQAGGGVGGITQLTGDVTAGPGSGSQAATIPNATITYAKIQNESDATLIGRSAGSAGAPMEIAIGSGLSLSGGTLSGTGQGAGGSPTWTAEWIRVSSFSHNFAVAGNLFTPTQSVTIYSASAVLTTTTGGTYKLGIAPYNTGTNQITSSPTYSALYTEGNGASSTFVTGNFPGGFNMTAGSTYVIFIVRTDSTTTVATTLETGTQMYGSAGNGRGIAFKSTGTNQSVHLASTGPLTSDTWTTETGYYLIHMVLALQ